jgi:hypothetical protein
MRLGFEGAYCINVVTRLLTLPLRTALPDFYIVGFPKAGTTSLAAYLQAHPAISGVDGLPHHEALRKESHFLAGALGRGARAATSPALYRSFFPTVVARWWAEAVLGVDRVSGRLGAGPAGGTCGGPLAPRRSELRKARRLAPSTLPAPAFTQWMCFDACPTYVCLPYAAERLARLTPAAKIVVMLRDPADGLFSSETMLRNLGCPLPWTLTEPDQGEADPRCGRGSRSSQLRPRQLLGCARLHRHARPLGSAQLRPALQVPAGPGVRGAVAAGGGAGPRRRDPGRLAAQLLLLAGGAAALLPAGRARGRLPAPLPARAGRGRRWGAG